MSDLKLTKHQELMCKRYRDSVPDMCIGCGKRDVKKPTAIISHTDSVICCDKCGDDFLAMMDVGKVDDTISLGVVPRKSAKPVSKWRAEWYKGDGTLFVSDVVSFESLEAGRRLVGLGEVSYGKRTYRYPLQGEVSSDGAVAFTYKAEKFPKQPQMGSVCMQLSSLGNRMEGMWVGLAGPKKSVRIIAGRVAMTKIEKRPNVHP